jgi:glutamyl-Q tRNA(Asp) synthetase
MLITRFAPSPSGYLHLGHAYSAMLAYRIAKENRGKFILRMEDIDKTRCKKIFEEAIFEDLAWLGLKWDNPVRRQSEHLSYYRAALQKLKHKKLVYPCFCTRSDIRTEIMSANEAPHESARFVYPGTCRLLPLNVQKTKMLNNENHAFRLDSQQATNFSKSLYWQEYSQGKIMVQPQYFGDIIIARKDVPTSYHLAVTLDDHIQGITLVTRGKDLFESTHIQRMIQSLLGLRVPTYRHHQLLRSSNGRRFAKRNHSITLRHLRKSGYSAASIWNAMVNENDILKFINSVEEKFGLV